MKYIGHIILGVILIAVAAGCRRPEVPAKEEVSEFKYEFRISHGIRNDASVVMLPQVAVCITEGDDAADYSMYFTINGKEGRTIKNLWVGSERDLSAYFSGCTAYGTYLMKGEFYRTDGQGEVLTFEQPVYMQGESVSALTSAAFVVGREERALNEDGIGFYVTEKGHVMASFAPKTAHVIPEVSWEGDECLDFNTSSSSIANGTVKVPFTAVKAGEGVLTFRLRSGESSVQFSQKVTCIADDSHRNSFDVSVSAPSAISDGDKLRVTLSLTDGDDDASYDVNYGIDGKAAASDKGVSLSSPYVKDLTVSGIGTHTLSVRVSRSDGDGTPVVKEHTFKVNGVPVTGITVKTADGKSASAGQTLRLTDPSAVSFKVSVYPENATVKSVSVTSSDASVLKVASAGTSSWTASAGSAGFGRAKLTVKVSGVKEYSFDVNVEVSHVVNVSVSEGKTSKGAPVITGAHSDAKMGTAALSGTWKAWYTGSCQYYQATGDRWNPSEETKYERKEFTANGSFTWNLSSASKAIFDLDREKAEVESMSETSTWWDDGNPAGEWMIMRGDENYWFSFTKAEISMKFTAPSSMSDLLVLKAVSTSNNVTIK